jgi:hypothetical protein
MTAKPKIPMQHRDIATRLQNWGLCQRGRSGGGMATRETRRGNPYGGQGYKCMTAVVCNMMREAAKGPAGGHSSQSRLNFVDGMIINEAWQKLEWKQKLLLRDYYVLNHSPNAICRLLDIPHWPARKFHNALQAAESAIKQLVDSQQTGAHNSN